MPVQVSGCYNHPERKAVATCSKCGVGLCESCVRKDFEGRVVCPSCHRDELRRENKELYQEYKEFRKALKERGGQFSQGKDFIRPGIIGGLLVIITILAYSFVPELREHVSYSVASLEAEGGMGGVVLFFVLLEYWWFSVPFCYIVVRDLFPPRYSLFEGVPTRILVATMVSPLIGGLVFTFYWVRFVIRKIRSRKKKDNVETPTTGGK